MHFDSRTANVMRKAARGPAAIALRQNRLLFNRAGTPAAGVLTKGAGAGVMVRLGDLVQKNQYAPARIVTEGIGFKSQGPVRLVSHGLGAINSAMLYSAAAGVRLGALGQSAADVTKAAGTAAVSTGAKVGGAALATQLGASGWVAGPIGAAVGVIVGLAVSKLLTKNYLNVANVNRDEDASVELFDKYRQIAGQAPGRAFGLPTMRALFKGAIYRGFFPKNNFKLCFHEGCFKYLGQPSMVDDVLDKSCGDKNCFEDVYPAFVQSIQGSAGTNYVSAPPRVPVVASPTVRNRVMLRGLTYADASVPTQRYGMRSDGRLNGPLGPDIMQGLTYEDASAPNMRFGRRSDGKLGAWYSPRITANQGSDFVSLGRLGSLGSIGGVPEAKIFIDRFFAPANAPGAHCSAKGGSGCYWAYPTSAVAWQLLYDVADAWLATKPITTTPYVAINPPPPPPSSQAITVPQPPNIVPPRPGPGGAAAMVPGFTVIDPTGYNGQPLYVRTQDGNIIGDIPTYAFISGQMVAVGTFHNVAAATNMPINAPPVMYQMPPTGGGGGGTLVPTPLPAPAPGAAAAGTDWTKLLIPAVAAFTLLR